MFIFNPKSSNNLKPALLQQLGGSPVYIQDLCNLQELSMLYGSYAQYKDWNVVLSGMLVDTLNTATKTVSLTEGYFQLNGIVYYFPATSDIQYPFEIVATGYDDDDRLYESGETMTFGRIYDEKYIINSSFPAGFNTVTGYPNKYSNTDVNAIYFDPFTCQRLQHLQANFFGYRNGDIINVHADFTINYTETGRAISGNALSAVRSYQTGNTLKWNKAGWFYEDSDLDKYNNIRVRRSGLPYKFNTLTQVSTNLPWN